MTIYFDANFLKFCIFSKAPTTKSPPPTKAPEKKTTQLPPIQKAPEQPKPTDAPKPTKAPAPIHEKVKDSPPPPAKEPMKVIKKDGPGSI